MSTPTVPAAPSTQGHPQRWLILGVGAVAVLLGGLVAAGLLRRAEKGERRLVGAS
ncbi:hypothetical protein [Streptomyces sp. 11x1]|uniref:hypothetical protein n=1 Tax=Streptomyces sp. 11x1 TaxID=3038642 RepID=UPI0029303916|nr:hypothetical protein [Streptomyces sp. 11x1]WNZ10319.1 hypothetical protein P8T65_23865 [Streptomyces sp. 11x1]